MTSSTIDNRLGERLSEHELCPIELLAGQEAAFARDIARMRTRMAEFVTLPCPACGNTNVTPAFEKFGFAFVRCVNCRTIYMNPRPSEAVMADYYANSENYAYWAQHIFPASEAARREKIHRPWLTRILSYCKEFDVRRGTLLEIGPGFGTFASVARESGAFNNVVVVEPTSELAAACRQRGLSVIEKRVEELDSEVPQGDIIVAFEVIEHLFSPRQFLTGIRPLLASRGLLVLSCPNGEGFDIAMLGAKALAVDVEHVNLFNPASLKGLLEACGYQVIKSQTPGRLDAEFVRDAALAGEIKLDPFLRRVLVDEWETHGWRFQEFLAEQGLSSHMWVVARRAS